MTAAFAIEKTRARHLHRDHTGSQKNKRNHHVTVALSYKRTACLLLASLLL
jgi:hypothetical protein